MADLATINAKAVVDTIDQLTIELRQEIDGELKDGADQIARLAINNAPADQGFLRNQIKSVKTNELEYEVVSLSSYSPYLEFGTMEKVSIPAGLEDYAAQFKGDFASGTYSEGGELTFKEAIFAWCQRKGIPQELWYAIYISIGIHGIEARPFFFPAVEQMRPIIIQNVEKAVKNVIES